MGHTALGPLAFWEGYEGELLTLAIYGVGIAAYAMLNGLFYITLSQRNLVSGATRGKGPGALGWILIFPLVTFGMFLVLSLALFVLAKEIPGTTPEQRVRDILLLSMALVAGVRVTAYVSEHAAVDLAKLVPLGLLGVLLIDPGFLTLETPLNRLAILTGLVDLVARYLITIIVMELALRALWLASGGRRRAREKADQAEVVSAAPQHR